MDGADWRRTYTSARTTRPSWEPSRKFDTASQDSYRYRSVRDSSRSDYLTRSSDTPTRYSGLTTNLHSSRVNANLYNTDSAKNSSSEYRREHPALANNSGYYARSFSDTRAPKEGYRSAGLSNRESYRHSSDEPGSDYTPRYKLRARRQLPSDLKQSEAKIDSNVIGSLRNSYNEDKTESSSKYAGVEREGYGDAVAVRENRNTAENNASTAAGELDRVGVSEGNGYRYTERRPRRDAYQGTDREERDRGHGTNIQRGTDSADDATSGDSGAIEEGEINGSRDNGADYDTEERTRPNHGRSLVSIAGGVTATSQEVEENKQHEGASLSEPRDKGSDDNGKTETKVERILTQEEIQSLLIKAINFRAQIKDIRTVIGCGADVNKPVNNGLHPLHYAAYTDFVECVEVLINSGANVNITDDIGYTPLHLCARRGNYRSMAKLIENGSMVNFSEPGVEIHQTDEKNKLGYTTTEPLNLAIQNGHTECVRLLLQNGARPDNKYFMGYEICLAPLDQTECLELLLKYGADPNVFNRCGLSPLMKACKDHHIEAVRILIKYGADVNAQCPPLFEQKSVLQFAIMSGNIVIINILLGKGAKFARQGEYKYSALHTAIIKGRADICRLLLQHGADANERTDEGATPLMIACCTPELKERKEIVQLLIDCKADVNAHSPSFSYFDPYLSPLTEYFKNILNSEGFSIVPLLLRHGAEVHFSSSGIESELLRLRDPFSILPYAYCMSNNLEMFELLMDAANKYCPIMIHVNEKLPEHMKDMLLYKATRPRGLKHQIRIQLRRLLSPGLPDKVKDLPIPALMKSYLLFE